MLTTKISSVFYVKWKDFGIEIFSLANLYCTHGSQMSMHDELNVLFFPLEIFEPTFCG